MGVERLKENLKTVFTTEPVGDPAESSAQGIASAIIQEIADPVGTSVISVNGKSGDVTITASDLGLANVDNTSDADKPISTATQAALDDKLGINDAVSDSAKIAGVTPGAGGLLLAALTVLSLRDPNMDGTATPGTSNTPAREDHTHPTDTKRAAAIHGHGQLEITGLVTALAEKSDTDHAHMAATQSASGFMSEEDKAKLDGIAASATNVQLSSAAPANLATTASAGASTQAARADHAHKKPTAAEVGAAAATHGHAQADITGLDTSLAAKADLVGGKIPTAQLPAYVDDVLEYAALSSFPATGEAGKIYIAQDTNKTYRWSGTAYAEISASIALGETSATAYRGDKGKTAYDHSQATGNPHGLTPETLGAAAATHGHSAATTSVAGFMSNTDKAKLDSITAGTTAVSLASTAPANLGASAAVGTGATAARADHVHKRPTLAELGAAASSHGHAQADITGLVAALAAKLDATAQAADSAKLAGVTPGAGGLLLAALSALSSLSPKANGTAAVGTSNKPAREDHVHPLQTSVSGNAGTATQALSIKPLDKPITLSPTPTSVTKIIKIATLSWTYAGTINISYTGNSVEDVIKVEITGGHASTSGIRVIYGKLNIAYGIKKIIVTCDTMDAGSNRQLYAEIVTYPNPFNSTARLGVVEKDAGIFTPSMTEVSSVTGTVLDNLSLSSNRGDISSYQHGYTKNITGNVSGNAGTATKLAASVKIGSVDFDGSADIEIPIENYSTTEKIIGTWIDGKPLYRKVVNLGALPNATGKAVAHGISNIGFLKLYGYAYTSTGVYANLPFIPVTAFNQGVDFYISAGNILIQSFLDRSNYTGVAVLEYTKTTD